MNKDEIIKELTDSQAIQKNFMANIRAVTSYNKAQREVSLTGESPQYATYMNNLNEMLNTLNLAPEYKQIYRFILNTNFAFLETMAENNRKLLSLIFQNHHE